MRKNALFFPKKATNMWERMLYLINYELIPSEHMVRGDNGYFLDRIL